MASDSSNHSPVITILIIHIFLSHCMNDLQTAAVRNLVFNFFSTMRTRQQYLSHKNIAAVTHAQELAVRRRVFILREV